MLEVLTAVVMMMALAAIAGLILQSVRLTAAAADHTTAVNLAQQQLEELKSAEGDCRLVSAARPVIINNRQFLIETVAEDSAEHSQLTKVTVTVSWHRQAGRSLELIMLYDFHPSTLSALQR